RDSICPLWARSGHRGHLFDHLVSAEQDRLRHIEAERFGGLAIEDELEFRYPLNRKIGRFGAFENLVHKEGGATKDCNNICSVAQNSTGSWGFLPTDPKKACPCGQGPKPSHISHSQRIVAGLDTLSVPSFPFLA